VLFPKNYPLQSNPTTTTDVNIIAVLLAFMTFLEKNGFLLGFLTVLIKFLFSTTINIIKTNFYNTIRATYISFLYKRW